MDLHRQRVRCLLVGSPHPGFVKLIRIVAPIVQEHAALGNRGTKAEAMA